MLSRIFRKCFTIRIDKTVAFFDSVSRTAKRNAKIAEIEAFVRANHADFDFVG